MSSGCHFVLQMTIWIGDVMGLSYLKNFLFVIDSPSTTKSNNCYPKNFPFTIDSPSTTKL